MDENNLKTVLDAGARQTALVQPSKPTDLIVAPPGYLTQAAEKFLEPYLDAPRRLKANVTMNHLESFIEYVNLFKRPNSRIFATVTGAMTAILDYHVPPSESGAAQPCWSEHKASYAPVITEEWKRWQESNKDHMTQTELAEFIEENQDLIVEPSGSSLLEMVQDLEGKNHIDCASLSRLQNGATRLVYSEEVALKGGSTTKEGSVDFPAQLVAGLVPFDGGPAYKVRCRLRYRIESRRLQFWYEIVDPHLVIKSVVEELVKTVEEKTAIKTLTGTP